nr:reverse transcriptase domain-containing protein [Tanacetum cinerariifolium]
DSNNDDDISSDDDSFEDIEYVEASLFDLEIAKADLFIAFDNSIPLGIKNFGDDSEGDIRFLEALLNDDSIPFPNNESSESDFDNLSVPRPPPEPPDADFDPDSGDEISVVINNNDKLEYNSSATIPRRRNKRHTPNIVKPEFRTVIEMADNHTMEELLQAPTKWYGEAIVILEINADHFEIKMNLLQLVQVNPYHGFKRENPHTHINNFKRITSTLKFRDVPNDVIKLMMFPYSLEGNARVWYNKEPPNSILTWEDLLNKFMN